MINPSKVPANIDEYIASYPPDIRSRLSKIREVIKKSAPEAVEKISYQMPSFSYNGLLVYFAAHTNHIGFYPLTSAIRTFKEQITEYKTSKGTIQFPHNKPLPVGLISDIVKFRVMENQLKADLRKKKK